MLPIVISPKSWFYKPTLRY